MLSREGRLALIDHLAQHIRNAREERLREALVQRFPYEGASAESLQKRKTALEFLDRMGDRDLLALRRELRVSFDPISLERLARPDCWKNIDETRVFISHKSDREHYAERLERALRPYGFRCFVARYDIEVGKDWREDVIRALFSMQAFVSIHTPGFDTAQWPMQEIGVAFGRQVPMLAIAIGATPGGLMEKVQAIKISADSDMDDLAKSVAQFLRAKVPD
jgi:hypothetical protein